MNYRQLVKKVDTSNFYIDTVDISKIRAQYNPERFHLWKSLHKGPEIEALNMIFSPHYRFLKDQSDKSYYKLQRMYGRNNKWIQEKIKKFLDVFESMKTEGLKKNVVIVEKPLIKNKYNQGFEIFEGHHRIACALVLKMELIQCEIIRRK
ncbi:MAG: hypothetical protein ACTSPQ_21510 [Candidatus Helarchaeota archaeon]